MVSIVILNYNTAKLTIQCISSFKEFHQGLDYEIIIVDNCSGEESTPEIKKQHPDIKWIQAGYNAGYARGNNMGIRASVGEHLLIVNSDIIFTEEVVSSCLNKADGHDLFISGCRLLNTDLTQQKSVYNYFGNFKSILENNFMCLKLFSSWFNNSSEEIMAFKGALLLFPRKLSKKTNIFSSDLCLTVLL